MNLIILSLGFSSLLLGISASDQNWRIVAEKNVSDFFKVTKYQSDQTGIKLLLSETTSPIVQGQFCLTTEAKDNDGLPHTLEHLVFLGSEEYPYKEFLDLVANKVFSERTNAFTEVDRTCYTVDTAGSSGFLTILPIFLDHILYPLLREEDFLTEVHHITENGEDAGVVYSEMQAIERSELNIVSFGMIDALYPGNSSYEQQAGGKLQNLRNSTTIEKVREYHRKHYIPENLYIVITGAIKAESIFKALGPVEKKIISRSKSNKTSYVRGFSTEIPSLTKNEIIKIDIPSQENKTGDIFIGWRIPGNILKNLDLYQNLQLLGVYLTSNTASPLVKTFLEGTEPWASNIEYELLKYKSPSFVLKLHNVPIKYMKSMKMKVLEELKKIANTTNLDMEWMKTLINRQNIKYKQSLENNPGNSLFSYAALDMVYGTEASDLFRQFDYGTEEWAKKLNSKPVKYWINLIKLLLNIPRVDLIAYPDTEALKLIQMAEQTRIQDRIQSLGEEGLLDEREKLNKALKSQILPPSELLHSIPTGDIKSISFINFTYYNYSRPISEELFNISSIPYHVHIDDVKSDFIRYYLILKTDHIPFKDRPYLLTLVDNWLNNPLEVNGTIISSDEVLQIRSKITLDFKLHLGLRGNSISPGSQSDTIMFYVDTLPKFYNESMSLLKKVLCNLKLDKEKISSILLRLINGISQYKNSSFKALDAILEKVYFNNNTYIHYTTFPRRLKWLKKIHSELKTDPESLMAKLDSIRNSLLSTDYAFMYMAVNLNKTMPVIGSIEEPWINLLPVKGTPDLTQRFSVKSENFYKNKNPSNRHIIIGSPDTESCYFKQMTNYDNTNWESKEVAILRLLLQYMTDRIYDKIRGQGLAYVVDMKLSVTEGHLTFDLLRSSQLLVAYEQFRETLKSHIEDTSEDIWDSLFFESAKGSSIYLTAEKENFIISQSKSSIASIMRGADDPYFNQRFIQRLNNVTLDEIKSAGKKYLTTFFNPNETYSAIVCPPYKVNEVIDSMQNNYGFNFKNISSVFTSFFQD